MDIIGWINYAKISAERNEEVKALMSLHVSGFTALAYAIFLGWYPIRKMPWGTWFAYHPFAMSLGMVGFTTLGVMMKRKGGYVATKLHGYLMAIATALSFFAFYVIYTNKNIMGKAHFTTTHGQIGLAAIVVFGVLQLFGAVALHPDFGIMNKNVTMRFLHKTSGKFAATLAWGSIISGFVKMEENLVTRAAALSPLFIYTVKVNGWLGMSLDARAPAKRVEASAPAPKSSSGSGRPRRIEKKPPHAKSAK